MDMLADWLDWLGKHKEGLSLVLSAIAVLVSIYALYRTVQRDRREIRKELEQKAPRITYQTQSAESKELFISEDRSSIPGWDFFLRLTIENRSIVPFTVERIVVMGPTGNKVRLHQPVDDLLKIPSRERPTDHLLGNRSVSSFKPVVPNGVFQAAFHLHIEKDYSVKDVQAGLVRVNLAIELEQQGAKSTIEKVSRELVLRPSGIIGLNRVR